MSQVIRPYELVHGHALSSRVQPFLGELLRTVRDGDRGLSVVVGAGTSMEVGLPSWPRLIANVADSFLSPDRVAGLALLEEDNIQRRALMAIAMALEDSPGLDQIGIVREALFQRGLPPSPGLLSQAIARLVTKYPKDVRLLTTNYDQLLEAALEEALGRRVQSFSLRGEFGRRGAARSSKHYAALPDTAARRSVLHLHGCVPWDNRDAWLGPVVLTETDYLSHGTEVVKAIRGAMAGRTTIFIGLSMTDSNVLAALRQENLRKRGSAQTFSVSVAPLDKEGISPQICAEIATSTARTLHADLGVKPILLKTYAQVGQLVSDLGLAVVEGGRYQIEGEDPASLRYGNRFRYVLTAIYSALGASATTGEWPPQVAEERSKQLHREFETRVSPLVDELQHKYRGEVREDERLGLFLWLRDIRDLDSDSFGLRLALSSLYSHWDAWASERVEPIRQASPFAAVQAVFHAQPTGTNIQRHPGASHLWRGSFAWPIFVEAVSTRKSLAGRSMDRVMIGALSINTTGYVRRDALSDGSREMSFLSAINSAEQFELIDAVDDVLQSVLE